MTIHLPKELERFVQGAVRSGRYARDDDVIRDALTRLQKSIFDETVVAESSSKRVKRSKLAQPAQPLTSEELHQRLLAAGLVTRLPDPSKDVDDDDVPPIEIEGEPLSETIIRERG